MSDKCFEKLDWQVSMSNMLLEAIMYCQIVSSTKVVLQNKFYYATVGLNSTLVSAVELSLSYLARYLFVPSYSLFGWERVVYNF